MSATTLTSAPATSARPLNVRVSQWRTSAARRVRAKRCGVTVGRRKSGERKHVAVLWSRRLV